MDQPDSEKRARSDRGSLPDEPALTALAQWWRRLSTPLMIALSVLLVGLLIFRWFVHTRQAERERAAEALYAAADANSYRTVVDEFSDTPSAAIAGLGLAASLFRAGEFEQAYDAYARFVDAYPDHPMALAAELCMVQCLEGAERVHEALEGYHSFSTAHPDHYLAPFARLGVGRVYEQLGEWEQARAVYEELMVADGVNDVWTRNAEFALENVRRQLRAQSEAGS